MVKFEQVRKIALDLPETSEKLCYGTPAFYVKKKLFARLREDHTSLAIKVSDIERLALCQAEPETFSIPQHYANYDMFVVQLTQVKPAELRRLLHQAWERTAPKKLLKT